MQTKPGSLLKSASSIPDISTVLAEVQGLKQQMDTMMSSVQAVQTKAWGDSRASGASALSNGEERRRAKFLRSGTIGF